MNPTITTIYQRRSVRSYKAAAVARAFTDEIIAAGKMAPSAINAQPWKFYVADNPGIVRQFSVEIAAAAEQYAYLSHGVHLSQPADRIFFGAPVVVFISAPRTNQWAHLDIGMCVQNMMLAATSMGLASCPIGLGKFIERTAGYPMLHIPSEEEIVIAVAIGYSDHIPSPEIRKSNDIFYLQ